MVTPEHSMICLINLPQNSSSQGRADGGILCQHPAKFAALDFFLKNSATLDGEQIPMQLMDAIE